MELRIVIVSSRKLGSFFRAPMEDSLDELLSLKKLKITFGAKCYLNLKRFVF